MRPFGAPRTAAISKAFAMLDAGEHMVAMHRVPNRIAPDKQVAFQIFSRRIRHNKTVPVAMRHEPPRQLIRLRPHRTRFRALFRARLRLLLLGPAAMCSDFFRRFRELSALLFLRQTDAPVRILRDFSAVSSFFA